MNIEVNIEDAEQALLTQAIANLERYDVRKEHGEPLYADTPEGLQKFKDMTIEYFKSIRSVNSTLDPDAKPIIPSIEGWVCYMGFSRQTLSVYKHRGSDWEQFISYVRENIATTKIQRLVTGQTSPIAGIFDLVNNFNYSNTSDVKHTAGNDTQAVSAVIYPRLCDMTTEPDNNSL